MEYYKLIALDIGDFFSSIFFEDNYPLDKLNEALQLKNEMIQKGYICFIIKTKSLISL